MIRSFNSTLVRFKPSKPVHVQRCRHSFQFHIGSIQADRRITRLDVLEQGFNSTLVRFKPCTDASSRTAKLRFQFHIGSIQAAPLQRHCTPSHQVSIPHWFDSKPTSIRWSTLTLSAWFQFHIGSIQSTISVSVSIKTLMFQFHIGSIQSIDLRSSSYGRMLGFNSTLVRFKRHDPAIASTQSKCRFQFHIGSIQAEPRYFAQT